MAGRTMLAGLNRPARVAVIGGGYAGRMVVSRLASRTDCALTLFDPRQRAVDRIRLHEVAAGHGSGWDVDLEEWSAGRGVTFERRAVRAVDGTSGAGPAVQLSLGDDVWTGDLAIVAAGSRTRGCPPDAVSLDEPAAARGLHRTLCEQTAKGRAPRVTVVGTGPTGLEVVTRLASAFPTARIGLWATGGPLWTARADAGVKERLDALGVEVVVGGRVVGCDATSLWSEDGNHRAHDHVVWCAGVEATAVPIRVDGAPVARREDGRIQADDTLRVGESLFVVGDQADVGVRSGCATALAMGAYTGDAVCALLDGRAPSTFEFFDGGMCLALDPGYGILQSFDRAGNAGVAVGGRAGGFAKAAILVYVSKMMAMESRGWRVHRWMT